MSNISKLIEELCPDGVEFKKLESVTEKAKSIKWGDNSSNDVFQYVDLSSISLGGIKIETTTSVTMENAPSRAKQIIKTNDIIFATTRPTQMRCALVKENLNGQIASTGYCVLRINDDSIKTEFIFHYLRSDIFREFLEQNQVPGNYPSISDKSLKRFVVPVPPLAVQEEIVRILDRFTLLEAELEAELEARRKQFAFYRDSLLNFENRGGECRFQWKPLSDIATIGTGSRNTNQAVRGGMYPFYVRSQTPLAAESFDYDEQAIITAGDGVGVGKVFHYQDGKYALHQRAYRIVIHAPLVEPKFVFYYIQNNFKGYIEKTAVHASVTSLRKPMFEKYQIPIPAMAEQQRTIEMLDRFDALVNDISSGLPAEIAARRKQYEHYRDQLLTFKELEPVSI